MSGCVKVSIGVYIYKYTNIVYTGVRARECVQMCTHVYTICMYIYICIYVCAFVYICVCAYLCILCLYMFIVYLYVAIYYI